MSNGISHVQITGFAELQAKLKLISDDRRKVVEIRNILRKVAGSTVATAKAMTPVSSGPHKARGVMISPKNLRKSIGVITGKNKTNPTVYVGARVKGSNKGWYAHFVHDGVNTYAKGYKRKHKRNANVGAAVKRSKGNPFLENAYKATQGLVSRQAESQVAKYFQKRINALSR